MKSEIWIGYNGVIRPQSLLLFSLTWVGFSFGCGLVGALAGEVTMSKFGLFRFLSPIMASNTRTRTQREESPHSTPSPFFGNKKS